MLELDHEEKADEMKKNRHIYIWLRFRKQPAAFSRSRAHSDASGARTREAHALFSQFRVLCLPPAACPSRFSGSGWLATIATLHIPLFMFLRLLLFFFLFLFIHPAQPQPQPQLAISAA